VNDFEIVAGVFAAIFILGIGVGVIAVIAMSALRRHRDIHLSDTRRRPLGPRHDPTLPWDGPSDPDDDRRPPRWPSR
jgi:hypothetical protein